MIFLAVTGNNCSDGVPFNVTDLVVIGCCSLHSLTKFCIITYRFCKHFFFKVDKSWKPAVLCTKEKHLGALHPSLDGDLEILALCSKVKLELSMPKLLPGR